MLDLLTNPDLISMTLQASHSTLVETELAYRLQHAIDEINTMTDEIAVLEAARYIAEEKS